MGFLRRYLVAAAMALIGLGALISPAAATSAGDLSGTWLNSADFSSVFHLKESPDQHTLTATWNGGSGAHASVVGSFTGTLNPDGVSYTGSMHVSEGSNSSGGNMTFQEATAGSRIPAMAVAYIQDNGVAGNFKLTAYALENVVSPPSGFKAVIEFFCPSQKPCQGDTSASVAGAGGGASLEITQRAAQHPSKKGIVGSAHFSVPAGQRANITLALNKAGRKLLAKRGMLRVVLQIKMKPSSGLPSVPNAGTVTFHKK
jgi:hypothetical protein